MAVQQADGAVRSLATGTISDQAFSPDGKTLYTARNGTITAYSVASGSILHSWTIGSELGGIDVSADGKYLVATEQQSGPVTSTGSYSSSTDYYVYRLDLTTGKATTYTHHANNGDSYYFDASFLPDGSALLTQNYDGSGWEPLTTLDFKTGKFTSSNEEYAQDGTLTASFDKNHIAFMPSNISDDPVFVYTAGKGITASHEDYADNVMGYNNGVQAISPDGNLVVQGSGLHVYDGQLHLLTTLTTRYPEFSNVTGLAFSPSGDKLYLLDATAREVIALDSKSFDVLAGYPVGASVTTDVYSYNPSYGDSLIVSEDGKTLSVIGTVSVQILDLTKLVSDGGTAGNDKITGDGSANVLYGFDGNDKIDGGAGADTMYGGPGNDTFYVDNPGDTVFEYAGEGKDTVYSSITYGIPTGVEALVLTGSDAIDAYGGGSADSLTGNNAANELMGSDGDDVLLGNGGNDILDGGLGNDSMSGGAGDDIYYVDSPADLVSEAAGQGTDLVYASFTYTLPANVENLTLTGSDSISATGNALDNVLTGNLANNVLTGGGGNDTFQGTRAELAGDTIADFSVGDRIVFTDADAANFHFSVSGSTLSFDGGSLTLTGVSGAHFVETVLAGGGVSLRIGMHDPHLTDVNGDGQSDILWTRSDGAVSAWAVTGDGTQVQPATFDTVPAGWHVQSSFDMNGDGRTDILWRNDNGALAVWQSTGTGFDQGSYYHGPIASGWTVAGTGDWNGDGKDDLIWRNASGAVSTWTSTDNGFSENQFSETVDPSWHIAATGDLNGDGRTDIVWRNDNGGVSTWLATKHGFAENSFSDSVSKDWQVAGIGDVDGDGRADIIWRNSNGQLSLWHSTGNGFAENIAIGSADKAWSIAAVGDYNGDDRADLLWHNANGAVSIWQSNGHGFDQNTLYNSGPSTDWTVAAHG